ncbi:sugar phosphate isomerase/epimerase family protein [Pseudoclostridium thermosuccinogenes]|uniref:sugar phosphate isomerase/epimerase family protein n=1 Tax=Clostridium thermosuccinogenes TaxID=84032 RepID=UPI002FD8F7CE
MKIGVCTGIENIYKLEEMGFDYLEAGVNSIASLEKEKFLELRKLVDGCSIKCEVMNAYFPWDMRLTGPDAAGESTVADYARRAAERAAALGTRIFVVGNGGARRFPDGWEMEKALEQFARAVEIVAEESSKCGIIVTVEPLNKSESNLINSVKESLDLIKKINHGNVMQMADFYHMRKESESMDDIIEAGEALVHTHIANSNGRVFPRESGEDDYESFFGALKKVGYKGRVSVEANTKDIDRDAPAALSLLRKLAR